MPGAVPSAFAKFSGMTHQDILNNGSHHDDVGKYAVSWYKMHLVGDMRYQTNIDGAENEADISGGQVFASPNDSDSKGL